MCPLFLAGGFQIWEYGGSKSIMSLTVDQEVGFIVYLAGGAECTNLVFWSLRGFTMSFNLALTVQEHYDGVFFLYIVGSFQGYSAF